MWRPSGILVREFRPYNSALGRDPGLPVNCSGWTKLLASRAGHGFQWHILAARCRRGALQLRLDESADEQKVLYTCNRLDLGYTTSASGKAGSPQALRNHHADAAAVEHSNDGSLLEQVSAPPHKALLGGDEALGGLPPICRAALYWQHLWQHLLPLALRARSAGRCCTMDRNTLSLEEHA